MSFCGHFKLLRHKNLSTPQSEWSKKMSNDK
jgi:hypothetical protein